MFELKSCPFCGASACVVVAEKMGMVGLRVRCSHCLSESDIAGLFEFDPIETAIETVSEYWNSRV